MTAETLTATRGASTYPGPTSPVSADQLCVARGTYAVAANVEDGDIFEMCWLPAGAVVLGGWVYAADLDTGTEAMDIDLGWAANGGSGTYDAADVDGLGNFGVWEGDAFATGNINRVASNTFVLSGEFLSGGIFPYFTKKTKIQFEANVAANSFTAGSISVVILYQVDPSLAA